MKEPIPLDNMTYYFKNKHTDLLYLRKYQKNDESAITELHLSLPDSCSWVAIVTAYSEEGVRFSSRFSCKYEYHQFQEKEQETNRVCVQKITNVYVIICIYT
jgi:hypothetical protein